jgi:hypothetical protein
MEHECHSLEGNNVPGCRYFDQVTAAQPGWCDARTTTVGIFRFLPYECTGPLKGMSLNS